MALRTFRGSDGVEWRVWSVVPGTRAAEERRTGYDRRSPDPVILYKGPDRRQADRRQGTAPLFPSGFEGGWLAFESPTERRRLAPIPPRWDRCSEGELERLCARASARLPAPPPTSP